MVGGSSAGNVVRYTLPRRQRAPPITPERGRRLHERSSAAQDCDCGSSDRALFDLAPGAPAQPRRRRCPGLHPPPLITHIIKTED